MSKKPSLKVNSRVIKTGIKVIVMALLVMVVIMGDASISYAKGKGKAKRKAHQLTTEITREIVHVTLPIKWPE